MRESYMNNPTWNGGSSTTTLVEEEGHWEGSDDDTLTEGDDDDTLTEEA